MNAPQTTQLVEPEIAVACRLLQTTGSPQELYSWLRNPHQAGGCGHEPGLLAMAVEELIGPLATDADAWLSKDLKHASVWYGYAMEKFAALHSSQMEFAKRQLLTGLLPLYRCLATRELSECFSASRLRMAEIFLIRGLEDELGPPLSELLVAAQRSHQCPDQAIESNLELNVAKTAAILVDLSVREGARATPLGEEAKMWLAELDTDAFASEVPDWADPSLLWKLAGEIISKKPNTLLPRSWVTVSVPWAKVTDHWRRIEAELERLTGRSSRQKATATTAAGTLDALVESIDQEIAHDKESVSSLSRESHSASESGENGDNPYGSSYVTAEIHNHHDPVFLSSLKRTIAIARKQERPLSLATIAVQPDAEAHMKHFDLGADGIRKWQSKLIDSLSGHPELEDTACFVSGQHELMVTIYDVDRGLATSIVRDAIVEVLACRAGASESLADIDVPAKFHVGIATASSPGPNLGAEELIAPSRRCFEAAARQGGASIKSIEVY